MTVTRPGPAALAPALAPGGLVIRVYAVPSAVLVLERMLPGLAAALAADLAAALAAALGPADAGVCLVVYDGDTGTRWTPEDWVRYAGGVA